ncbi:DUF368 domain-containing protein [Agromyces sp. SYSU T00194]|uniref:DUF368 domain-containing protein n=1 Tax=Agromyces chitinivorans TaxID=3158560 RepID=UPI00339B450B
MTALRWLVDLIRGALIGTVEIIPGVSGGTVALITGVYETVITSAGHLVRGVVLAVTGVVRPQARPRAREHLREVRWGVLIPLGIGMLGAIVLASALLAPTIDEYPVQTRAVFAGLIVASLIVPARMVGRWRTRELLLAAVAAAGAFVLTGLPAVDTDDPSLLLVAVSAAFAVCALVLPGVSGSFVLVVIGIYAPTLDAVNDRDLVYLGTFALGAIVGLAAFVSTLQWLLTHHRAATLAVMTGLMLGSLRALWPWQSETGGLEAPTGDVLPIIGLFLAGAAAVIAMIVAEGAVVRRRATQLDVADDEPVPADARATAAASDAPASDVAEEPAPPRG